MFVFTCRVIVLMYLKMISPVEQDVTLPPRVSQPERYGIGEQKDAQD